MARYKLIKPQFEKPEITLAKKREHIRRTIDIIYVILMVVGILVCGINQNRDVIVGWGLIVMGLISVPTAVFYVYITIKEWNPVFYYDYIGSKKQKEEEIEKHQVVRFIVVISLIGFAVVLPVLGIIRLC